MAFQVGHPQRESQDTASVEEGDEESQQTRLITILADLV